jgi:hypothetical protein
MLPDQVTGGRNGYGAKLANIFSTEFVIETCDGARKRQYRQVLHHEIGMHTAMHVTVGMHASPPAAPSGQPCQPRAAWRTVHLSSSVELIAALPSAVACIESLQPAGAVPPY